MTGSSRRGARGTSRRGRLAWLKYRHLTRSVVVLAAVTVLAAAIAGGLLLRDQGPSSPTEPQEDLFPGPKTAAIIDQLSLTVPNPDFVASATGLFERAGYLVDYYPGEQVTVDFFRDLPTFGYDLIVLRVHSGLSRIVDETGRVTGKGTVALHTGEPFSEDKYTEERERGLLGKTSRSITTERGVTVRFLRDADIPLVFSINAGFIEKIMQGRFDNTVIVMMGCEGLTEQLTAQAFLNKGARAFVSWSLPVSASHTDASTRRLLEKLLTDGLSVGEAVTRTAAEVGPDPRYGGELRALLRQG